MMTYKQKSTMCLRLSGDENERVRWHFQRHELTRSTLARSGSRRVSGQNVVDGRSHKQTTTSTQPRGLYITHTTSPNTRCLHLPDLPKLSRIDPLTYILQPCRKKGLENTHCSLQNELQTPTTGHAQTRLGYGQRRRSRSVRSHARSGI
jgi:hypothetical protein